MRKNALPFLFAWFLICAIAAPGTIYAADLQIERLTWAGVKLVSENTTVFIDAIGKYDRIYRRSRQRPVGWQCA